MTRQELIDRVAVELREGLSRGVFLVGSHGMGKTWLVGQVLAQLGPGAGIIRLSPSHALSRIPFGAVNARIGPVAERNDEFHSVLAALLGQVKRAEATGGPVVIVVDNGAYLDQQSAAVVAQALAESSAKIILVDNPGAHANALMQLWRDGELTRSQIEPLSHDEVLSVMQTMLAGTVTGAAALYLSQRTAGNPLLIKGLIAGALEDKTLRQVDQVWVLDHPEDHLGSESRDFLKMDLAALGDDSRRLVDILAMMGSLPLETVLALAGPDDLDDIQQREFAAITVGHTLRVELTRPALAPAIGALIPMGRSRSLRQEVAAVFDPLQTGHIPHVIADVLWAMDCGQEVGDELAFRAALLANHEMRPSDALRIGALVTSGPLLAPALAQRSLAYSYSNKFEQAQALAAQSLELAQAPEAGVGALQAYLRAYSPRRDFTELFPTAIKKFESAFGPLTLDASSSRTTVAANMVAAQAQVSMGESVQAARLLKDLMDHPLVTDRAHRTMLTGLLCEVQSVVGHGTTAFSLAVNVINDLEHNGHFPRPDIAILAYARAVSAIIYYGEWELAEKLLEQENFQNPNVILPSGGLRHLGSAMMNARRGRIEEAIADLRPGVAALADYDPWLMLPTALGLMAYCLALRGDAEGARMRLDQLGRLERRGNAIHTLEGQAYAAAAEAIFSDHDAGLERLHEIRATCARKGYLGIEFTVCTLALRAGDSSVLSRFAELARLVESKHAAMNVLWADAMVSKKGEDLELASISASENGYELLAAELAALAQRRFELRGKQHRSRKASALSEALRDQMPGTVSPVFRSVDQPELTRREHEIAKYVASGDGNNAIAERLHLSLRTVEGHLYRMFIKLDIKSREELAALINNAYGTAGRK